MKTQELETRVANLEAIVTKLQVEIQKSAKSEKPWWKLIQGTFADDEMYEEAMRLGREYRVSTKVEDEFDKE